MRKLVALLAVLVMVGVLVIAPPPTPVPVADAGAKKWVNIGLWGSKACSVGQDVHVSGYMWPTHYTMYTRKIGFQDHGRWDWNYNYYDTRPAYNGLAWSIDTGLQSVGAVWFYVQVDINAHPFVSVNVTRWCGS